MKWKRKRNLNWTFGCYISQITDRHRYRMRHTCSPSVHLCYLTSTLCLFRFLFRSSSTSNFIFFFDVEHFNFFVLRLCCMHVRVHIVFICTFIGSFWLRKFTWERCIKNDWLTNEYGTCHEYVNLYTKMTKIIPVASSSSSSGIVNTILRLQLKITKIYKRNGCLGS